MSEETREATGTLAEHLGALRRTLLFMLVVWLLFSSGAFFYAERIISLLLYPLTLSGLKPVQIRPLEYLFVKLKVAALSGLVLALPLILAAAWRFVAPGLRRVERRSLLIVILLVPLLFAAGMTFSYFTVLRYGLLMLMGLAGETLTPVISIDSYLSFVLALLLPFGVVFQMPLVVSWLVKWGFVTPERLKRKRKYALLLVVVVAALVTPTVDVISQLATAVPMYLLYELSLLVAALAHRKASDGGAP